MKHFSSMPMKHFPPAVVLLACITGAGSITVALTGPLCMTYREIDRGVEKVADFSIVRDQTGYDISIRSTQGTERMREELRCDSVWRTTRWHYRSDNNTDIVFKRFADSIALNGILRGKPVSKILRIDAHPWYQVVTMGMQAIAADSAQGAKFWAVSIDGPAVLKAAPFRVVTIADTSLPGHPKIQCRRVQVKLDGVFGRLWDGFYFIRSDNGRFVHYEGYRFGSKKPTGTIDIMR